MRVFVKDMSGVSLYHTTPRKARLLLKENKATVESNNPFTIRLLFPPGECGLRDSKEQGKSNSILELPSISVNNKPIRENTMCERKSFSTSPFLTLCKVEIEKENLNNKEYCKSTYNCYLRDEEPVDLNYASLYFRDFYFPESNLTTNTFDSIPQSADKLFVFCEGTSWGKDGNYIQSYIVYYRADKQEDDRVVLVTVNVNRPKEADPYTDMDTHNLVLRVLFSKLPCCKSIKFYLEIPNVSLQEKNDNFKVLSDLDYLYTVELQDSISAKLLHDEEDNECKSLNDSKNVKFDCEPIRSHHFECLIQGFEQISKLYCCSFSHKENKLELSMYIVGGTYDFINSLEKKEYKITINSYYPDGRIFNSTTYKAIYDHKEENLDVNNKDVIQLRLIFNDAKEVSDIDSSLDTGNSKNIIKIEEVFSIPKTTDVSVISSYLSTPSLSVEKYGCVLTRYGMFCKKEDRDKYYNNYPVICLDTYKLGQLSYLNKPDDINVYFKELYENKHQKEAKITYLLVWKTENGVERRCHLSFTVFNYNLVKDIMDIHCFIASYLYVNLEYVNIHVFMNDIEKEEFKNINNETINSNHSDLNFIKMIPDDCENEAKSRIYLYYLKSTCSIQCNCYIQEFVNFILHKIQEQNNILFISSNRKGKLFSGLEYHGIFCKKENIEDILGYDTDRKEFLFADKINPQYCAQAITNLAKKLNKNIIAVLDTYLKNIDDTYLPEEYYRELVKECKNSGISLIYGFTSKKNDEFDKDSLFFRFADMITFLK